MSVRFNPPGSGYVQSPVSWPGGKLRMVRHLLPLFPRHSCYVEVFGGGAAVLINKDPSKVEVYNDINSDLVRFWRCVQYHCDEFIRCLGFVPRSREEFEAFLGRPGLTDIQEAVRWYYLNICSFGGASQDFGYSRLRSNCPIPDSLEALLAIRDRFKGVLVEKLDWRDCLRRYDRQETLFFVDPPYVCGAVKNYDSWSQSEHEDLRDRLCALRGRWVLTYDDCDLVRNLYSDCEVRQVSTNKGICNFGASTQFLQLIIFPKGQALSESPTPLLDWFELQKQA